MDNLLKNNLINVIDYSNQFDQVSCISYRNDKYEPNVILYTIQASNKNGSSWTIDKRFSQFDELHKQLKEYFGNNLPSLPKKSYLTFLVGKSTEDLEERKYCLDEYLKNLIIRPEVFNSIPLRKFLELDKYASEAVANPPQFQFEYKGFIHGVRDFIINNDQDIMFVLDSDMNVLTRVDAYLSNMKMPWDKEKNDPSILPVSCVECFIKNKDGIHERSWTKFYSTQAICLYWDPKSCVLLIGLDNGSINYLSIPQLNSNFTRYEESLEIESHSLRVMGVYYDSTRSLIHSVSKDQKYRVLNIQKQTLIADYEPSEYELTYLLVSDERKKSFIADRCGSIFIFDLADVKPKPMIHLASSLGFVRGMDLDERKNYLMAIGYNEGDVIVYDIGKPGKEAQAKDVSKLRNRVKSRELRWSTSRSELFIGNDDGTVTIWDAKKTQIIFVLKAHEGAITRLQWDEKDGVLMTGSKDKSIKSWKLPQSWRDQKLIEEEEKEELIRQKTENILALQRQKQEGQVEEDDLGQWHKDESA